MAQLEPDVSVAVSATGRSRPALALNDIVYNVALGSNMDSAKLRARNNGDGKHIEPLSEGVACKVQDWELSFKMIALPPIEPVMAGAVSKKGAALHGVLWKLKREDYEILAKTEGIFTENPAYVEREVLAVPYGAAPDDDDDGGEARREPVRALVFALRVPDTVPANLYPSERYKGMMVKGARSANLAAEFVRDLDSVPTAPPSHNFVLRVSQLTAMALFFAWKNKWLSPYVRGYYTPLLAHIYSAREKQIRNGRPLLARIVTAGMLAVMAPMSIFGFCRFIYLGRDVEKILAEAR